MSKNLPSMTVSELIEALKDFETMGYGDHKVVLTADYGDRAHTLQALTVNEISRGKLEKTGYSASGLRFDDLEESSDPLNPSDEEIVLGIS